jgi:predicted TIM-barrel fold metal-dependent hydrolase
MDNSGLVWIDAHHHLWDLSKVEYPWLLAKGEVRFFGQPDPIRKNYLVSDYQADTRGRVAKSVHVQVGARSGEELRETAFVDACSRESGGCCPAAAVVAVDLGLPGIERQLEQQLAFPLTRGVRHMIGKSPEENPTLPPFVPEVWRANWRRLEQLGLTFDLQLTEDQYQTVLAVLQEVPGLRVAICHLASPWDRSSEGFRRWRGWMRRFAELPNVAMKISGLAMFTKAWDEELFLDWAEAALEIFGADRCMLGSNFPVDSLYVSYDDLFSAWLKLARQCSPDEAVSLAGGTAGAFYSL